MSDVWTIHRIWTTGDYTRPVRVETVTNDDNDDGHPDPETEQWENTYATLLTALKITGPTRIGCWGHQVSVYLDGEPLTQQRHDTLRATLAEAQ